MLYSVKVDKLFELVKTVKDVNKVTVDYLMEKFHLSEKKALEYYSMFKFVVKNFGRDFRDFDEFKSNFARFLLENLRVGEALNVLFERKLPLNVETLKWAFKEIGLEKNIGEAKAIIDLLKQLNILISRRISLIALSEADKIYEFVLERGKVRYSMIEGRFKNARDNLIKLFKNGRVVIEGLEDLKDLIFEAENLDRLVVNEKVERSPFFKIFQDKLTGERYAKLVIPRNAVVYAKW